MIRSVRRVTVTIAAASLLAVGLAAAPASAAEPAADLIISEVIEGGSNNKAIEIANATGSPVDLAGYSVQMYFNGATSVGLTISLTGTVAAGDVHVLAQSAAAPAILAVADQTNGAGWFNGDDAIVLQRADVIVDSFGQAGFDPGTEWGTGLTSTADNTLRRAEAVCAGDTVPNDVFDPAAEWVGFATDTFDGLGAHTATCGDVEPADPVINEFSASTTGTDVEYLELLGGAGADLSGYAVLEVEGDAGSPIGVVDGVIAGGTADADGRYLVDAARERPRERQHLAAPRHRLHGGARR